MRAVKVAGTRVVHTLAIVSLDARSVSPSSRRLQVLCSLTVARNFRGTYRGSARDVVLDSWNLRERCRGWGASRFCFHLRR